MIRQRYPPQHTATIGAEAPHLAATFDAKSDGIGTEYVRKIDGPNGKTSAWIPVLGLGFGGVAASWRSLAVLERGWGFFEGESFGETNRGR